jgi:predicted TPR repeat methyltransferase
MLYCTIQKDYMEGVDLSPKMTQKAKALSGIYNVAKPSDLQGHLRKCPNESFDLIISCDVLMYLYDLAPLFKEVKRVLQKGGTFAFSTEALDDDDDDDDAGVEVLERESGRYAHSRKYVNRLATAAEDGSLLELQSLVNVLGRMDEGKEIRSDMFVFQLNSSS